VKRVIAVPDDRIRISRGVVILNEGALDEKYVTHEAGEEDLFADDIPSESSFPDCEEGHEILSQHVVNGEIVVPAGEYFVLGDRREISLDSRCFGFVGSGDLIGKPLMIYDSVNQTAGQESRLDLHWIGDTRWARLFKLL
jgi:signal peptidase I